MGAKGVRRTPSGDSVAKTVSPFSTCRRASSSLGSTTPTELPSWVSLRVNIIRLSVSTPVTLGTGRPEFQQRNAVHHLFADGEAEGFDRFGGRGSDIAARLLLSNPSCYLCGEKRKSPSPPGRGVGVREGIC
ncbi:hypothetical protein CCP3SC1_2420003 [Gammaproteobacteria bacterium]